MTSDRQRALPFNTPLETGLRSVALLVSAYPQSYDLQRLVVFDHLVVHTGDVDGPESLHAAVPMRTAELLVRRSLVERGLLLMVSKGLIVRHAEASGISYTAGDFAEAFLTSLGSAYMLALRERAGWVVREFGELGESELRERIGAFFDHWIEQFQVAHKSLAGEL